MTRQIIAKLIGKRHGSHLALSTLRQAFTTGRTPTIFHADQGAEFMAQRCTDYLENHGVEVSVSDVASPWQNGNMKSCCGRFKHELGDSSRFESVSEMIEAI